MGDLEKDTAVLAAGDGRYTAQLSSEWEIWGPMGGYVAAVALRAAGAESAFARPASFFCQYLGVAAFDEVDIVVTSLRSARTALAQRVEVTQGDTRMLEATVWSIGDVDGLTHGERVAPPRRARPDRRRRPHGLDRPPVVAGPEPGRVRRRPAAVPAHAGLSQRRAGWGSVGSRSIWRGGVALSVRS